MKWRMAHQLDSQLFEDRDAEKSGASPGCSKSLRTSTTLPLVRTKGTQGLVTSIVEVIGPTSIAGGRAAIWAPCQGTEAELTAPWTLAQCGVDPWREACGAAGACKRVTSVSNDLVCAVGGGTDWERDPIGATPHWRRRRRHQHGFERLVVLSVNPVRQTLGFLVGVDLDKRQNLIP